MKNTGFWDRLIRGFAAILLFLAGFFWLGGWMVWLVYGLAAILAVTALTGVCPLYKLFGFSTLGGPVKKWVLLAAITGLLVVAAAGAFASDFFSRKFFLEEYNAMNNFYKQTLFQTGQGHREEAIANYEQWVAGYAQFEDKYLAYHPYALKGDSQFNADLQQVDNIMVMVRDNVYTGDLHQAHLALEEVRPIFQDVFKRNGFSMLAIALVDFHDAMELILDAADTQNPQQVIELYPQVDEKLKAVEQAANDAEIQTIRQNLDAVLSLAQANQVEQLPDQAATLKSSFVKVYLKRG